jgi:hypothetical protein
MYGTLQYLLVQSLTVPTCTVIVQDLYCTIEQIDEAENRGLVGAAMHPLTTYGQVRVDSECGLHNQSYLITEYVLHTYL